MFTKYCVQPVLTSLEPSNTELFHFSLKDGRQEALDSPRSYHHLLKNHPGNISFMTVKVNTGVVHALIMNTTREAAPMF